MLLLVHFIFTTVEYEFSTSCCDVIDMTFETKALRDDRRNVRCSTRLDKMSDIEYQDRPNDNYPAHKQTYCEGLDNQVPRISIVRWNMTDTIVPGVRNMYTFVNMSGWAIRLTSDAYIPYGDTTFYLPCTEGLRTNSRTVFDSGFTYNCVGDFIEGATGCRWDVYKELFDGSEPDFETNFIHIDCAYESPTNIGNPFPPAPPHPPPVFAISAQPSSPPPQPGIPQAPESIIQLIFTFENLIVLATTAVIIIFIILLIVRSCNPERCDGCLNIMDKIITAIPIIQNLISFRRTDTTRKSDTIQMQPLPSVRAKTTF
mgnify:CR=1 FL=1